MIKGMLKTGLFLFVVAAISGVLLAYTQSLTAPVIEKNQKDAEEKALNLVLPSLRFSDEITSEKDGKKITYRVGYDKNGDLTGAVFKVSPKGFGGLINTMVGINKEGQVVNYKILSLSETPGLGSKLTSDDFTNKFKKLLETNKTPIFKVKKDKGDVDAVTAATISSRAFCVGINEALNNFNIFKEQILANKYSPSKDNKQNGSPNSIGGTK